MPLLCKERQLMNTRSFVISSVFVAIATAVVVVQNAQTYGQNCAVINGVVYECDGTTHRLTERDKANQLRWALEFQQFMLNQFPIGFPFVQNDIDPEPPMMTSFCRVTCPLTLN
ncbi:unnamed protein product [Bursaphelenchus xylophilus]|uniref:(pine wood nematode) hypothetical protein n=1 Tax=Bursaphelenchus xylophilus TaxID=6326 RepID=A0A1I7S8N9_BURXY|nr:unnamed protein product [Bursaphelenchus xylophilus]CAG9089415.1 unnamed protein product [Bursaphelenchus xylophilus]